MTEVWKLDRIGSALAGTNPTVLARLPRSFAVIGDTQFLPGYCVLLVDSPSVERLTDLPKAQRREFLDSMDTLGEAVEAACRCADPAFRRMNYEILGNTDAYLHAHLFPRYEWEPQEYVGHPVWRYDPDEFYAPAAALGPEHDELRARIVAELARLGRYPDAHERDASAAGTPLVTEEPEIRRATADEWKALRSTRLRAVRDSPSAFASTYEQELDRGEDLWKRRIKEGTWVLAWRAGEPVGIVAGFRDDHEAGEWHLVSMWVSEEVRGTSTATRLAETVCACARADGASVVSLWVADGNDRARRFYERLGFRGTGDRQPLPSNPEIGEERLALRL